MTEEFYAHIAADIWLAKGKAALTLLACYFTLKLLTEYEESYLAPIKNVLGFCHLTGFGSLTRHKMPRTNPLIFKLIFC